MPLVLVLVHVPFYQRRFHKAIFLFKQQEQQKQFQFLNDEILFIIPSNGPDKEPFRKVLEAIKPTNITYSPKDGTIHLQNITGSTCNPTSQIRIVRSQNPDNSYYYTHNNSGWKIETYDSNGSKKTVGGDEFYIEFYHESFHMNDEIMPEVNHPLAVAEVEDRGDGTYELEFIYTPMAMNQIDAMRQDLKDLFLKNNMTENNDEQRNVMVLPGGGNLTIHFVLTCDIGRIPPPLKDSWKNGGHTQTSYTIPTDTSPPMNLFQRPNRVVDFSKFQSVIFVGDSLMEQFRGKHHNFRSNVVGSGNVRRPLSSQTWNFFANRANQLLIRTISEKVAEGMKKDSQKQEKTKNATLGVDQLAKRYEDETELIEIALVMGGSTWEILADDGSLGENFEDHLHSMMRLIPKIRSICDKARVNATFIWKSATPVHPHIVIFKDTRMFGSIEKATKRVKYMSGQRSANLYSLQKRVCEKLNVPFLDVYQSYYLSGDWHFPTDGRHWRSELNQVIFNWFYSEKSEDVLYNHREELVWYENITHFQK